MGSSSTCSTWDSHLLACGCVAMLFLACFLAYAVMRLLALPLRRQAAGELYIRGHSTGNADVRNCHELKH